MKERVVWTSSVGAESGASITNTVAGASEAVARAGKQVVVASEPLQERRDEGATGAGNSGIEPGGHSLHPNPLNRARERRRARLEESGAIK